MRKVLIVMFMTIDGVAEFPAYEGETPSSDDAPDDSMWTPLFGSIDTLLLGRQSYRMWADYWPHRKEMAASTPFEKQFSRFADAAEKVVFSKTLPRADWPNSRIVRGDIGEEIARMKRLPGKDMALGGGPKLAQSFLALDLADEVLLEVFPSIVGSGKPFFHVVSDPEHAEDVVPLGAPGRHDFRLIETRPRKDGTVFLHYARREPVATH
jgi:dihydrofolate reductase